MTRVLAEKGSSVHFFVASSGNAGLAAAYTARSLGVNCTVYVTESAGLALLAHLKEQQAYGYSP